MTRPAECGVEDVFGSNGQIAGMMNHGHGKWTLMWPVDEGLTTDAEATGERLAITQTCRVNLMTHSARDPFPPCLSQITDTHRLTLQAKSVLICGRVTTQTFILYLRGVCTGYGGLRQHA